MTSTALLVLCLAVAAALGDDIPSPDTLLADHARYDRFLDCLGGQKASCEPWVKDVTAHIADALKAGCASCPKPQKDFIRTVTLHMKNNQPEKFAALVGKHDKERDSDTELFLKFLQSTD